MNTQVQSPLLCPVCDSGDNMRLRSIADTQLFMCRNCHMSFCSPLPSTQTKSSGQFTVTTAEGYSAGLLRPSKVTLHRYTQLARGRYERYRSLLGKDRFSLLEVGCGPAGLAPEFHRCGVAYEGMDLDHRMIDRARRDGVEAVRCADFMLTSFATSYDVICFHQVLEHISSPRRFVKKVADLLSPGGVVHCDVPNDRSLSSRIHRLLPLRRNRFGAIEYPHHLFSYSRKALATLFEPYLDASIFVASLDDETWGQASDLTTSTAVRLYNTATKLTKQGSLTVLIGTKLYTNGTAS